MDEKGQEARTVAIMECCACGSGLLDRDKYCRWCGERQHERTALTLEQASAEPVSGASLYATSLLATSTRSDVYRRVSAPLVSAVVTGALTGPSAENQSRFVKRVILGLISIPIWLIIVLLSPLDAYAAVKNLAGQE